MKKLLFIIPLFFISCASFDSFGEFMEYACFGYRPSSVEVTIIKVEQEYSPTLKKYSDYVAVYYKITNTGKTPIDIYQIVFSCRCRDWPNDFEEIGQGANLAIGETQENKVLIWTAGFKQIGTISWQEKELIDL